MKRLAPICLFTYNREIETKATIEALKENHLAPESDLIIFSDGGKSESSWNQVFRLREYLKTINGFKSVTIRESEINKGLANSIISGVTDVVNLYGKVIVLEDDLISSPFFLNFMNSALQKYELEKQIYSINGFSVLTDAKDDVYVHTRPFPWGWGTWKDRWDVKLFDKGNIQSMIKADSKLLKRFASVCGEDVEKMLVDSLSGKNNSWYIRWTFYHYYNNWLSLYPKESFIENIGFNENGTNCKVAINPYKYEMYKKAEFDLEYISNVDMDVNVQRKFLRYFSKMYRLQLRLNMLGSYHGIKTLFEDLKLKLRRK